MTQPPPLPKAKTGIPRRYKAILLIPTFGLLLVLLRAFNLLIPFRVPTGAMAPAVRPGDHVYTEGMSYLLGKVERGDIIVFKTDTISEIRTSPTIFLMRAAGLPGERVRIEGGKLFINDQPVSLKNEAGEIRYANMARLTDPATTVTVPGGHYFVLGDTSTNSFDSATGVSFHKRRSWDACSSATGHGLTASNSAPPMPRRVIESNVIS
jgi:signal peptidase I